MRPGVFVAVAIIAWMGLALLVGGPGCACAAAAPGEVDVVAPYIDDRLDRGLSLVRRAFPRTDMRVIQLEQSHRAHACLIKIVVEEKRLYPGAVRAEHDGSATVFLRRADFTPWTVYHEVGGHLFHGHVCAPIWQYYIVELWPLDFILWLRKI